MAKNLAPKYRIDKDMTDFGAEPTNRIAPNPNRIKFKTGARKFYRPEEEDMGADAKIRLNVPPGIPYN